MSLSLKAYGKRKTHKEEFSSRELGEESLDQCCEDTMMV